jgi:hypothetical protein
MSIARAAKVHTLLVTHNAAPCADTRTTVLPSLQADVYDALELDPEETSATLPAPGGVANAVRMERAASFSRIDNCHCNFWIANGEADFSTLS